MLSLDLNLHGYQDDHKQHVAVSTLISLLSFYLHAIPLVFSVLLVYFLGLCQISDWRLSAKVNTVHTFPLITTCVTKAACNTMFVAEGSFILLTGTFKY